MVQFTMLVLCWMTYSGYWALTGSPIWECNPISPCGPDFFSCSEI